MLIEQQFFKINDLALPKITIAFEYPLGPDNELSFDVFVKFKIFFLEFFDKHIDTSKLSLHALAKQIFEYSYSREDIYVVSVSFELETPLDKTTFTVRPADLHLVRPAKPKTLNS
jgi:hypothetical protein